MKIPLFPFYKDFSPPRSLRSLLRKEIKILNRRERRERGEFSGEKPLNISFFLFDSFSIILSVLSELCGEYILAVFSSLDDLFIVYGVPKGHEQLR